MNNLCTTKAGALNELHQTLLTMVSDAYLFHLVSTHRRPVYRHQYGDISLNQSALHGFIDSYLRDKGWSTERLCEWYGRILNIRTLTKRGNSTFIDWGTVPALTPRGIRWLNACFSRLGEMVNEKGSWNAYKTELEGKKI